MQVRFVYLDAGGTMLAPWPSVGAVYARAAAPFGLEASVEALEGAFKAAWRAPQSTFAPATPYSEEWWRRVVFAVFAEVGFAGAREEAFAACWQAFAAKEAWRVFDDVAPLLKALRARGIGLGVLSNWDLRLRPLLEALELTPYFQELLISAEVGQHKPDPALFGAAVSRAGVPAGAILHVGDDPELDYAPAIAAGMQARLLDRRARWAPAPYRVTTLAALRDL